MDQHRQHHGRRHEQGPPAFPAERQPAEEQGEPKVKNCVAHRDVPYPHLLHRLHEDGEAEYGEESHGAEPFGMPAFEPRDHHGGQADQIVGGNERRYRGISRFSAAEGRLGSTGERPQSPGGLVVARPISSARPAKSRIRSATALSITAVTTMIMIMIRMRRLQLRGGGR